jgi:MoxR-like ATPase
MTLIEHIAELEEDFANLARLAANESYEDVRLLLAKIVRKYRSNDPKFSERINQSLRATQTRSTGSSALRKGQLVDKSDGAVPVDADSRLSLIRAFDDRTGIDTPLLSDNLTLHLSQLITERRERDKLVARGVSLTRSAVLIGPPGVGKTFSARWLAAQLGQQLWVLDLTTVMSSLLGKTGNNLRAVFDYAKSTGAVLLLDEIDAIAKRRSDDTDVGELKRLVTVILQEVDSWPDTSLLLAATNHPELVDPALWRRFDLILTFDFAPAHLVEEGVKRFFGNDLPQFESLVSLLASAFRGDSLSDIERAVKSIRRSAALSTDDSARLMLNHVMDRASKLDKRDRRTLAVELAKSGQLSHNKIMSITGISRDTIRKYAGPSPILGRSGRKGRH